MKTHSIKFMPKMNYDEAEDVLYAVFGTNEPSYCVEVDDTLLIELGVFSHVITGFRILDFKKHKVEIKSIIQDVTARLLVLVLQEMNRSIEKSKSLIRDLPKEIEEIYQ